MTEHQLHLLDVMARATYAPVAFAAEREAIRAILAERAELLGGCKIGLSYAQQYSPSPDASGPVGELMGIIARAEGGRPCGS